MPGHRRVDRDDRGTWRLTLVISSLRSGGAERVMAVLAGGWAARGDAVTLLTFTAPDEPPFFPIDPRVQVRHLDLEAPSRTIAHGLLANVRRAWTLRRAIRSSHPDVVVSFMDRTNVLTLVASLGLSVPVVVEEHNDPAEERVGRAWTILRDLAYRRAARVVALSATALDYFAAPIRRRGVVIPNPVVRPLGAPLSESARPAPARPTVIAMGRLVPQKGFDLLLDAFARIRPLERGWTLDIRGEGPLRAALEAQRERLGLTTAVRFPGTTPAPGAALAGARVFVLSSRYEGFPTVLGEAMALGLPVVAFDCPSGPRELVRDGVDGLLVPAGDRAALAAAMERVLTDADLSAALSRCAPDVLERFGLERILDRWDALFAAVTTRSAR